VSVDMGFPTIRRSTCAVGYTTSDPAKLTQRPDAFEVMGTGFVVGPHRRVLTCAHVIKALETVARKRGPRRVYGPALQFVMPAFGGSGWITNFRGGRLLESDEALDVALLEVIDLPPDLVSAPITTDSIAPQVGEEIGVCGYAHGSALLRKGKEIARFGPVLQRGIVAAQSPYDHPRAEIVLLDLIAGPAASGSPVFRVATGEVCGVLFEGQINRSAALSAARLMHVDAEGELAITWARARPVPLPGPVTSAHGSAQDARIGT
jgi:trypsin-like peptidase